MANQPFLFLPYIGKLRESFKKLDKALEDQNKDVIETLISEIEEVFKQIKKRLRK